MTGEILLEKYLPDLLKPKALNQFFQQFSGLQKVWRGITPSKHHMRGEILAEKYGHHMKGEILAKSMNTIWEEKFWQKNIDTI